MRRLTPLLKPLAFSPLLVRASRTCCGVSEGYLASNRAAAPVTCGLAMLVPDIFL
ncbi:hypothetical protein D3C72_2125590 [compost metagenome]